MEQNTPESHFTATVDGIVMAVRHRPSLFAGHDHFEFRHPEIEGKPIPISETGYRSHFVHGSFVEEAGGAEAFAQAFALAILRKGRIDQPDAEDETASQPAGRQWSLFD